MDVTAGAATAITIEVAPIPPMSKCYPSPSLDKEHLAWKTQKRRDCHEMDDDNLKTVDKALSIKQSKRFKGCFDKTKALLDESIVNVSNMSHIKKGFLSQHSLENYNVGGLSPITEISKNLSDTTLDGDDANTCITDNLTIPKRWRNTHIGADKFKISQTYSKNDSKTTTNIQSERLADDKLLNENLPRQLGARRLNMNMSMHEMPVDEVSFYDDEHQLHLSSPPSTRRQQLHSLATSPQLMGLLSPEGSPQRFQIVERPLDSKFLRPSDHRPPKLLQHFTNGEGSTTSSNTSPKSLRIFHSLSSSGSMESSMDDEYMELFEMESLEQLGDHMTAKFPSNLNSLISGNIKSSSCASPINSGYEIVTSVGKTPEIRRPSVRRCLSLTENCHQNHPKTPEVLKQVQETVATTPFSSRFTAERKNCMSPTHISCFKRPDPPSANCSPVQPKRCRGGDEKENVHYSITTTTNSTTGIKTNAIPTIAQIIRPPLRKCMSMNDAEIMSALARSECKDEPDLIGDFSKPFALPLMEGRHRDLKSISSDTVARLLKGEFDNQIASYKIIDCRYPYEYEGGHIRGAQNIYTQEQIFKEFLTLQQKTEHQQLQQQQRATRTELKRSIIIFHCEFSSERGPKLSRFLRNNDRARNTNSYPTLDYPEIYLLHNGYKEFYETHSELCEPIAYRPMLEPAYNDAYRHFRAKSKSWNGDGPCGSGGGGATSRLKKSRSRLML